MAPPTNQELNTKREENCVGITPERKYFRIGNTMVKRSLRPTEWQNFNGYMHVPLFNLERILNEGVCLQFLAKNTNIPLPKLHACFEDDGAAYLITERVEGVTMKELDEPKRAIVAKEVLTHLETLSKLTSATWGGPGGAVLPPHRVMITSNGRPWKMRSRDKQDLVFCHNDLSTSNIIVNPDTLKIAAIIDWEYAGFFPPEFEFAFYRRLGPSGALEGEIDDVDVLTKMLSKERL